MLKIIHSESIREDAFYIHFHALAISIYQDLYIIFLSKQICVGAQVEINITM